MDKRNGLRYTFRIAIGITLLAFTLFIILAGIGIVCASRALYIFDSDIEGWFNEPEEGTMVTAFNSSGPFDGGALVAFFGYPRDVVNLEHAFDPRWSSLDNAYSKVTLDVKVSYSNNIDFVAYRIKEETQEALYISGSYCSWEIESCTSYGTINSLGDNRYNVELVPADPSFGPFWGRDRVGLNLDIKFEPMNEGSITIDNIEGHNTLPLISERWRKITGKEFEGSDLITVKSKPT